MSDYVVDNYPYPLGKDLDGTKTTIKEVQTIFVAKTISHTL